MPRFLVVSVVLCLTLLACTPDPTPTPVPTATPTATPPALPALRVAEAIRDGEYDEYGGQLAFLQTDEILDVVKDGLRSYVFLAQTEKSSGYTWHNYVVVLVVDTSPDTPKIGDPWEGPCFLHSKLETLQDWDLSGTTPISLKQTGARCSAR